MIRTRAGQSSSGRGPIGGASTAAAGPAAVELEDEAQGGGCDMGILFVVGVLMTLGAVMVYSASVTLEGGAPDWRRWWTSPLRQCVFAALGLVAMFLAAHMDFRLLAWQRPGDGWRAGLPALLAAGLIVTALIPGVGVRGGGAQRSIPVSLGGLSLTFQPAELAKLAMVVWLAALLSRNGWRSAERRESGPAFSTLGRRDADAPRRGGTTRNLGRPALDVRSLPVYVAAIASAGVLIGLTAIEDFGTAALMGVVMVCMLFAAGARWSHLLATALLAVPAAAGLILIEPYRVQRVLTYFSANPDPSAEGYQVTQALIAIGSGGWWGRGLGAGVQKYGYLPQDNNDFILAVVCEELGVAGGIVVALLFLVLLWRGARIAARAADPFGRLLAAGVTLLICLQAAFNFGVVTNSVPTKGISLPFVSAGGSGVLVLGLAAGLLASVRRSCPR
jgi:cell division protein FtsW